MYVPQRFGQDSGVATVFGGNSGVVDPHTHYRGVIVSSGTRIRLAGGGVTVIVAAAGATAGLSGRLYILPKFTRGPSHARRNAGGVSAGDR